MSPLRSSDDSPAGSFAEKNLKKRFPSALLGNIGLVEGLRLSGESIRCHKSAQIFALEKGVNGRPAGPGARKRWRNLARNAVRTSAKTSPSGTGDERC